MKKIILGLGLNQREAQCSFCGEHNKPCVQGTVPVVVSYEKPITKSVKTIDDWEYSFSFKKVIVGDYNYADVVIGYNPMIKTNSADICKDCVTQLSALLK